MKKIQENLGLSALVLVSLFSSWTVSFLLVSASSWSSDDDASSDSVYNVSDFLQPAHSASSYAIPAGEETFWPAGDEEDTSGKDKHGKKDKFGGKKDKKSPPPPHPPPRPTTTTTTTTKKTTTTTTTTHPHTHTHPHPPHPPPKKMPVKVIPKPIHMPMPAPPKVIPVPYPSPTLTKSKIKKLLLLLLLGSQMFRKIMSDEDHNSVADLIRDYDTGKLDELERILWDSYQHTGGAEEDISAFLRHLRDADATLPK